MLNNLRNYRKTAGMSLRDVGGKIGLSVSQLSRIERGKAPVTTLLLDTLAELYSCNIADLLTSTPGPLKSITVKGSAQAGTWVESMEWDRDHWYAITAPQDTRYGNIQRYGVEVRGPSMDMLYPPGTVLICVKFLDLAAEPSHGQRVIVTRRRPSGLIEATVKEFQVEDSGDAWLVPKSSSPQHQAPIPLNDGSSEEVGIIALVIGSYRPE
jgi:transcriptional regulator with XRE-family HTH domain